MNVCDAYCTVFVTFLFLMTEIGIITTAVALLAEALFAMVNVLVREITENIVHVTRYMHILQ